MSKSDDKILTIEILFQGIGVLISWNAILSSLDWYNNRFYDYQPGFWLPLMNYLPSVILQPLTIAYGSRYSFNIRIVSPYIIISSVLITTPIIVELSPGLGGFIAICILTFIMGAANTVVQTSVFGLASTLPHKHMNMIMLGNGISGLAISIIRLICLFTFPQNSTGYLLSTSVYFIISGAMLIVCCLAQLHLMKNPLVVEALSKTKPESVKGESLLSEHKELGSFNEVTGFQDHPGVSVDYKYLFKCIWQHVFLVWLNYVITFVMLSHVALATEASGLSYPIFTTLMIITFNLFDVIGRYTPLVFIVTDIRKIWLLVLSRFAFWATFLMVAADDPTMPPRFLFGGTWFKFLNMSLYAYTNGAFSTFLMVISLKHVPDENKDRVGYIMVTGLLLGIFSGVLLSFVFQNVGHVPS